MLITAYKQQRWFNKMFYGHSKSQYVSMTAVSLFTPIDNTENTNSCALTICSTFNSNVPFFFFTFTLHLRVA